MPADGQAGGTQRWQGGEGPLRSPYSGLDGATRADSLLCPSGFGLAGGARGETLPLSSWFGFRQTLVQPCSQLPPS